MFRNKRLRVFKHVRVGVPIHLPLIYLKIKITLKRLNKYTYNRERHLPCNGKRNQVRSDTSGSLCFSLHSTNRWPTATSISQLWALVLAKGAQADITQHLVACPAPPAPCWAPEQHHQHAPPPSTGSGAVAGQALLPAWCWDRAEPLSTSSARVSFLLLSVQFIADTFWFALKKYNVTQKNP